jgi:predicted RNA-binding Zn ribbon-like protein
MVRMRNNRRPVKQNRSQAPLHWAEHHFINRHPALDFANTVVYRHLPDRREDRLTNIKLVRSWGRAAGLPISSALSMQQVKDVREAIDVFFRGVTGRKPDVRSWRRLIRFYAVNASPLHFVRTDDGLKPLRRNGSGFLGHVLHSAVALALAPSLRRVKACPACGWLFLDRTRNRSKRWCITALCGNRAKTRRHYRRRKARANARLPSHSS